MPSFVVVACLIPLSGCLRYTASIFEGNETGLAGLEGEYTANLFEAAKEMTLTKLDSCDRVQALPEHLRPSVPTDSIDVEALQKQFRLVGKDSFSVDGATWARTDVVKMAETYAKGFTTLHADKFKLVKGENLGEYIFDTSDVQLSAKLCKAPAQYKEHAGAYFLEIVGVSEAPKTWGAFDPPLLGIYRVQLDGKDLSVEEASADEFDIEELGLAPPPGVDGSDMTFAFNHQIEKSDSKALWKFLQFEMMDSYTKTK